MIPSALCLGMTLAHPTKEMGEKTSGAGLHPEGRRKGMSLRSRGPPAAPQGSAEGRLFVAPSAELGECLAILENS